MVRVPPSRFEVEALHERLCQRIAELRSLVVADVTRVFLEVSSLPCARRLWSFEFAFDEDDGRVARLEARFTDRGAPDGAGEDLRGYEVQVLLPRVIPARAPADGVRAAVPAGAPAGSLVERFVRALADLGAYRAIEALEARSAEVYLL
ncbi:MAG: hypothetical protein KIS78_17310 [Labilithrix sp.]|nr:hypothetical protein [Labilithrix sp.]MCW5834160.1 hypothetical protein [Labilithrix sp.]